MRDGGLGFNRALAQNGYAWWYIDALSDDGQHGLTIIVFLGSVFSPYYALARARNQGDPLHFCAVNVALYNPRKKMWAMTERGRTRMERGESWLTIGPSTTRWDGNALTIELAEITFPLPSKIAGRIVLHPRFVLDRSFALDPIEEHLWKPIAPSARVEVQLNQPELRWSGEGYLDMNTGAAPLESAFNSWHWSRAALRNGTAVLYDVQPRNAPPMQLALAIDAHGNTHERPAPARATLPSTLWGIKRQTLCDASSQPDVIRTLEDTPFYARSLLSQRVFGEETRAVHESLSLDRFSKPWVQMLLPFRMPRRA